MHWGARLAGVSRGPCDIGGTCWGLCCWGSPSGLLGTDPRLLPLLLYTWGLVDAYKEAEGLNLLSESRSSLGAETH